MAEFVQLRLEESLPALKELQKAGIFNANEIRLITKKRKSFEYRLQRHVKSKEDYITYIEYEINLLKLFQLRQKRLRVQVDYSKVNYALVSRINAIFRHAVFRFQSDVKLWLSFIQFVRQVKWTNTVSRLYAAMLRVHSNKPEIWIAAAKFEMEEVDAPDVARKLFLRGLRFHRDSKLLHLEYFKMELILARKKRDELGIEFHENVEKTHADDPVVTGKIALAVYRNAVNEIQDVFFTISFLKTCETFHYTYNIQEVIYLDLKDKFPKCEESLALLAKKPFREFVCSKKFQGSLVDIVIASLLEPVELDCLHGMEDAIEKLPTEKMWSLYVDFCHELLRLGAVHPGELRRRNHLLDVLSRAANQKLLAKRYYDLWTSYAKEEEFGDIMELATKQFPDDVTFWVKKIQWFLKENSNVKSTLLLIEEAQKSVLPENSYKLWNLLISLHMANYPKDVSDVFERGLAAHSSVASKIKSHYLEWVLLKDGIKAGRKLFRRLWSMPPITLAFFDAACDMELAQPKPSVKHLSEVMDAACSNFGNSNVDLWIRYVELVKRFSSDIGQTGTIHWRAVKALDANLVDKFTTHYALLGLSEN